MIKEEGTEWFHNLEARAVSDYYYYSFFFSLHITWLNSLISLLILHTPLIQNYPNDMEFGLNEFCIGYRFIFVHPQRMLVALPSWTLQSQLAYDDTTTKNSTIRAIILVLSPSSFILTAGEEYGADITVLFLIRRPSSSCWGVDMGEGRREI